MALDNVSAEASVSAHGEFEIDKCVRLDTGKRSAIPRFFGQIGAERGWRDFDGGQANTADRDAVALFQFLHQMRGGDGKTAVPVFVGDPGDASHFFNDAGEHGISVIWRSVSGFRLRASGFGSN